jgi:hypothetical protein
VVVSRVIDTALILVAIYLGLSLVVSNINEQIAAFVQWRGKTLYSGVLNLLSGSADLVEALFQHPLIAASQCDADGKIKPSEQYRPSYIGPRDFSVALWQSVATAKRPAQATEADAISYALNQALVAPPVDPKTLEAQVALVPDANLRASLYSLLGQAEGDYQQLLRVTDAWFNRQMDRVAGWYRRKTQYVVIAISVILVAIIGVDSVRIVTRLYADDAIRSALTKSIAATIPAASPSAAPAGSAAQSMLTPQQQQNLLAALDDPSFVKAFVSGPIFWANFSNGKATFYGPDLIHSFGLLITIVALALGAPFWFDALQFFVNTRLAGPKPQTTTDSSPSPPANPPRAAST